MEKQKVLKSTVYDFGNTSLYTGKDEVGNESKGIETALGVKQSEIDVFGIPAKAGLARSKQQLAASKQVVTENALERDVSIAWYKAYVAKKQWQLYLQKDSVYAGFLKAAGLHYKTQQTSKVEYFAAKARCQELTVKIKQSESNYRASLARLNQYIGIPGMFGIPDDENDHAELFKNVLPADSLKQRAVLEYYNNEVAVTKAAWKKEQANYLPKIDLGYSMQSVDGQSGFYSWEVGVSVPLLFFSQTGKTRAARLDYEIAEQNLRQKELEVYATCQELLNRFNTQRKILKYYITQALPLAKEQIKAAGLEYKLGNINYIQFLENVETSMKIRQEYLTSFMEYHTIEEQLKYITGK